MNFYANLAACLAVVCVGALIFWRNSLKMRPNKTQDFVAMCVVTVGLAGMFLAALG